MRDASTIGCSRPTAGKPSSAASALTAMGNPCTRFASGPGALTQTEADLGEEVYEAVPPILVVIVPRGQKAQLGGGFTGLRNAKPSPVGNAEGRVWGTIANTARDRNAGACG